eukprot:9481319-Alexandrium_andersonii.AAC.1
MPVPAALGWVMAPGLVLRTALPVLPDPPCVMWQGVVFAHDVAILLLLVTQADHGGGGATL